MLKLTLVEICSIVYPYFLPVLTGRIALLLNRAPLGFNFRHLPISSFTYEYYSGRVSLSINNLIIPLAKLIFLKNLDEPAMD